MALHVRLSGTHHYRGRAVRFRSETKVFEDVEHARRYVRKVTENARQDMQLRRGRNASRMVTFISVWPDDVKAGDVVDVWNHKRGWHKGEVYEHPVYMSNRVDLRTRSLPEER